MSKQIIDGIPVWGEPDPGAIAQMKVVAKTADAVALMADHHKGYSVPIGGVVAYKEHISPSGVGFDIACGNKAVQLDATAADVRPRIKAIMDDIWENIAFGIGQNNPTPVDHELFDDPAWKHPAVAPLKQLARNQLGTIGSGNHYVDVFVDEESRVWIGVHFGSRGLGHKITTWFLEKGGGKDGMDVEPCLLYQDSDLGAGYIECMQLAGKYAYAGRDWVCQRVADMIGTSILNEVHNHHNFAWREWHAGLGNVWVIRKGATPAFPGQRGFVGGSMGERSFILMGMQAADSKEMLYSTVHGAGRVMGRMEAKGKWKKGVCIREPKISQTDMDDWVEDVEVELRGAGVDEAPQCYKRIDQVLRDQGPTIQAINTLTPIGVAMAEAKEMKGRT